MALTNRPMPQLDFPEEEEEEDDDDDDMNSLTDAARRILNLRAAWVLSNRGGTSTFSPPSSTVHGSRRFGVQIAQEKITQEIIAALETIDYLTFNPSPIIQQETNLPPCPITDFGSQIIPTTTTTTTTNATAMDTTTPLDDNDPSHRRAICTDTYNAAHPPFQITLCAHIFGQPCLEKWTTSTSENANRCPFCRAKLWESREDHPPLDTASAIALEMQVRVERLTRALLLLDDLDNMVADCFGWGEKGVRLEGAMREVNWGLFEGGVEFGFVKDEMEWFGWGLRRVDWGALE